MCWWRDKERMKDFVGFKLRLPLIRTCLAVHVSNLVGSCEGRPSMRLHTSKELTCNCSGQFGERRNISNVQWMILYKLRGPDLVTAERSVFGSLKQWVIVLRSHVSDFSVGGNMWIPCLEGWTLFCDVESELTTASCWYPFEPHFEVRAAPTGLLEGAAVDRCNEIKRHGFYSQTQVSGHFKPNLKSPHTHPASWFQVQPEMAVPVGPNLKLPGIPCHLV